MFSQNNSASTSASKSMNFNSTENKELLWKTLSDNGLFNGINSARFGEVQRNFEDTIRETMNETYGNRSIKLQEQNHLFISKMVNNLKQFKNNEVYTAQDIKNQRKDEFERDLESKQRDFDLMMKKDVPQDIDFSDEGRTKGQQIEEKLENIDALLEQQQREREKDLFAIQHNNVIISGDKLPDIGQGTTFGKLPDIGQGTTPVNNQIHASNINSEISNNLLSQLLAKMDAILNNQEEIKELIRLRKKKSTKPQT